MIRWYDYPAAFIAADMIYRIGITVINTSDILVMFFCSLGFLFVWDVWNYYCETRKNNDKG